MFIVILLYEDPPLLVVLFIPKQIITVIVTTRLLSELLLLLLIFLFLYNKQLKINTIFFIGPIFYLYFLKLALSSISLQYGKLSRDLKVIAMPPYLAEALPH